MLVRKKHPLQIESVYGQLCNNCSTYVKNSKTLITVSQITVCVILHDGVFQIYESNKTLASPLAGNASTYLTGVLYLLSIKLACSSAVQ